MTWRVRCVRPYRGHQQLSRHHPPRAAATPAVADASANAANTRRACHTTATYPHRIRSRRCGPRSPHRFLLAGFLRHPNLPSHQGLTQVMFQLKAKEGGAASVCEYTGTL